MLVIAFTRPYPNPVTSPGATACIPGDLLGTHGQLMHVRLRWLWEGSKLRVT